MDTQTLPGPVETTDWWRGNEPHRVAHRAAAAVRAPAPLPFAGMLLLLAWGAVTPARAATTIIDGPVTGPITVNAGDTVEIHTGGAVTSAGVGVTVNTGGELIIFDGSVSGGVFIDGGTVTISGGSVSGSIGVAFAAGGGTLTLSGGSVSGNHGVILNAGGTANISGGTVAGGGNAVLLNGGLANISGGTITGTPNANNIGVSVGGGLVNISGGSVSGKFMGMHVGAGGVAIISGGSVSGTPGADNPGVDVAGGTLTLSGGSVFGKVGVQVTSGTATLSGGTVSGEGNGLKVTGGAANISGGSVSGTLLSDLSVSGGTATISGCNLLLADTTLLGILQDGTVLNMPVVVGAPGQLILDSDTMQITCPPNQTALATSAAGAVVTFSPPLVSNTCGGPVTVTSVPASGSTFPVGTTPVTCTVTDLFGNRSSCSFTVTVLPAADLAVFISAASDRGNSNPLKVNAKQTLTYTIVVINGGPNPADSVAVQDILPAGFILQSATTTQGTLQAPPPGGTGTLTASLGTLTRSGSATVRISGHFRERKSTIPNTASVSTSATDPNPANNQATVNVIVN